MRNHQRNCGLSSALAVYIPVAARKRRMDFLLARIRFPVARIWRTSVCAPFEPAGLLLLVLTRRNCHKPAQDTTTLLKAVQNAHEVNGCMKFVKG
jgi:hypothetical protein